jgi:methionine sulfoxide reductase catalytic subunit
MNHKNAPQYQPDGKLANEITPESLYLSRRKFMRSFIWGAGAITLAACGITSPSNADSKNAVVPTRGISSTLTPLKDELGDRVTPYDTVTGFNNYYEFALDKESVAEASKGLITSPWQIQIGGLVERPAILTIDEITTKFQQEERIYRLRCVEGWSMVIPWKGFQLSQLLEMVSPKSEAKYVSFETLYDPDQMPGQRSAGYSWPYTEGLRLDEAMNSLTLLATGLYGKPLPPQDGAPIRLVVPWKYGFKSIKSITKINLVADLPPTFWSTIAPDEYGFYANVNPEVSHPRWSQENERRLGELGRRPTIKFNGYEKEVSHLYAGMDLVKNY